MKTSKVPRRWKMQNWTRNSTEHLHHQSQDKDKDHLPSRGNRDHQESLNHPKTTWRLNYVILMCQILDEMQRRMKVRERGTYWRWSQSRRHRRWRREELNSWERIKIWLMPSRRWWRRRRCWMLWSDCIRDKPRTRMSLVWHKGRMIQSFISQINGRIRKVPKGLWYQSNHKIIWNNWRCRKI